MPWRCTCLVPPSRHHPLPPSWGATVNSPLGQPIVLLNLKVTAVISTGVLPLGATMISPTVLPQCATMISTTELPQGATVNSTPAPAQGALVISPTVSPLDTTMISGTAPPQRATDMTVPPLGTLMILTPCPFGGYHDPHTYATSGRYIELCHYACSCHLGGPQ